MENENKQLHYMQVSVDHMEMMDFLTDEQRGILLRLVFDYFRDKKTKENVISEISRDNNIILPIFAQLATSIDRGRSAYIERCKINSENGKKGGAPKGNQNARKRKEKDEENPDEEKTDEEPKNPGGGVTLTDVRQYQIDERIGTADLVVKFFHGFTDSGTQFPKDWKTVYRRCAAGTKDEQSEFFRILNDGGYRQKWGAVGE